MKKCHWVHIFLFSLCIHLVVLWPLPQSIPHAIRLQNSSLQVQLREPLGVNSAVSEGISRQTSPKAVNTGKSTSPLGRDTGARSETRKVRKSLVSTQHALPSSTSVNVASTSNEEIPGPYVDLDDYKFALAAAITAHSNPQSSDEASRLHGVASLDVHIVGDSAVPRIVLADSSGIAAVDTYALKLVRTAVEQVASPLMLAGKNSLVRMTVVIGRDRP